MVRLNLEGIWVDLSDFEFEMKWKHPINNNLKGESTTYSTDITAPLTANNRLAFDYGAFTVSKKTNRYLYGIMYVNGTAMNIRCYVKSFKSDSVIFYVEQFLKGGVTSLIKDEANLPDIFAADINAGVMRDVLINAQDGSPYNPILPENQNKPTTPNIFHAVATPYIDNAGTSTTRPSIYADETLLQKIADYYGFTLVNVPTNYWVFANQWKVKNSMLIDGEMDFVNSLVLSTSIVKYNLYVDETGKVVSTAPIRIKLILSDFLFFKNGTGIFDIVDIYSLDSNSNYTLMGSTELFRESEKITANINNTLLAGTYSFVCKLRSTGEVVYVEGREKHTIVIDYEASGKSNITDAVDFALAGYYPCWQDLPAVTAKTLIETIALCAGKMVKYEDNSVRFIDFENVFGWENAMDVSNKLISWEEKDFRYLDYNNATVVYKSGKVIASVIINDETLTDKTNTIATIDALRIEDDTANDRNKDSIVIHETTDTHFDIIDKLPMLFAPMLSPSLFQATFIYFEGSQRPLLIRQLGGIYIALESIMTTKNTITLKLLKLR